jgi:hypothetical protein
MCRSQSPSSLLFGAVPEELFDDMAARYSGQFVVSRDLDTDAPPVVLRQRYGAAGDASSANMILRRAAVKKHRRREALGQYVALVHQGFGDTDQTFAWLESHRPSQAEGRPPGGREPMQSNDLADPIAHYKSGDVRDPQQVEAS